MILSRARSYGERAGSRTVIAGDVAFVTNEYALVMAVRTDGSGDVTQTHVVWTADEGMSDASSPLCDGNLFLQVHGSGLVTCYDARQGKLLWEAWLDSAFWASPALVGNTVYLPGDDGKTYIFELGREFTLAGTPDVGEPIYATPAFADSRIYIRGDEHLFCIGKEQP